jgi:hypothetical protein
MAGAVMLEWIKRRIGTPARRREPDAVPTKPPGRAMSGKYVLLHKYLENRYANTVVLTFSQIEDLLGFSLPEQARQEQAWWTEGAASAAGPSYADAWILASRSAKPNLVAHTVTFERAA